MNNTFNINRFGLLLKRQWLDFGKIYLMSLAVLGGIIITAYLFKIPLPDRNHYVDDSGYLNMSFRYPLFLILGFIFISIIASGYFSSMGQKSRSILELLTPASTFEKFLCAIFYTSILSIASFLLLYFAIDIVFVKYINSFYNVFKQEPYNTKIFVGAETLYHEAMRHKDIFYAATTPFLIIAIFLLGSIYFNRFHYIKTAVSVMVYLAIAAYIVAKTAEKTTANMTRIHHTTGNKDSTLLAIMVISILLTFIFWVITFIRLKEKEV